MSKNEKLTPDWAARSMLALILMYQTSGIISVLFAIISVGSSIMYTIQREF